MPRVPAPLVLLHQRHPGLAVGARLLAAAAGGLLVRVARHARRAHAVAAPVAAAQRDVAVAVVPVEIVPIRHHRGSRTRVAPLSAR